MTTDDIVTRLRDLREVLMGNPIMAREVQEAMDEIEYLRSEMGNLDSEYNKLWRKYEQALKDNSTLIHVCRDPERKWMCGE